MVHRITKPTIDNNIDNIYALTIKNNKLANIIGEQATSEYPPLKKFYKNYKTNIHEYLVPLAEKYASNDSYAIQEQELKIDDKTVHIMNRQMNGFVNNLKYAFEQKKDMMDKLQALDEAFPNSHNWHQKDFT
jgi:hypothetical protein